MFCQKNDSIQGSEISHFPSWFLKITQTHLNTFLTSKYLKTYKINKAKPFLKLKIFLLNGYYSQSLKYFQNIYHAYRIWDLIYKISILPKLIHSLIKYKHKQKYTVSEFFNLIKMINKWFYSSYVNLYGIVNDFVV